MFNAIITRLVTVLMLIVNTSYCNPTDKDLIHAAETPNFGLIIIDGMKAKVDFFNKAMEKGLVRRYETGPKEALLRDSLNRDIDELIKWVGLNDASGIMFGKESGNASAFEGKMNLITRIGMMKGILIGVDSELDVNYDLKDNLILFSKKLGDIRAVFTNDPANKSSQQKHNPGVQ